MSIKSIGEIAKNHNKIQKTDSIRKISDNIIEDLIEFADEVTEEMELNPIGDYEYNEGGMQIPVYYQDDYESVKLGSSNIKDSGCGYTSIAMIMSYLKNERITPEDIAEWAQNYYVEGVGMDWSLTVAAAEHYGTGEVKVSNNIEEVRKALEEGKPVMVSQNKGLFTGSGHLLVLRGLDENGRILVNDPNKENAEGKNYKIRSFTDEEIDSTAAQYWIFDTN